ATADDSIANLPGWAAGAPGDPGELRTTSDKIAYLRSEIDTTKDQQKVYLHMIERLGKELHLLTEKNGVLEKHLVRKKTECDKKKDQVRKLEAYRESEVMSLFEKTKTEAQKEFLLKQNAVQKMFQKLQEKKTTLKRRLDFARWRKEVAMEAANESFHQRAGRLRKMWAIEKLQANYLQKVIFSQVEKSQATEEGFQKIRELTGLTDVMEIVHRLLDRDLDQVQLKSAVQEAEAKLEAKNEENIRFKTDAAEDNLNVFSSSGGGTSMPGASTTHSAASAGGGQGSGTSSENGNATGAGAGASGNSSTAVVKSA
ncbi:unnamed protein product, partial [Amoebophrya sp. A120]